MTKKTVLMTSFILSVASVASLFSTQIHLCPPFSYGRCVDFFDAFFIISFPIIPLFIFSLITYKMKDDVFRLWWKFAGIWTLLSMSAIIAAPEYSGNILSPIEKGSVALFFAGMFVLISTILIIYKSLSLRKK